MTKSQSSGNGNQMRQLIREGKSASKVLQAQIDTAVKLADREIGIRDTGHGIREHLSRTSAPAPLVPSPESRVPSLDFSGLPSAPTLAVPPTPPPDPISTAEYTERIRAGW